MENHKAIPQGYMTVGELAKKMDTTVRTLQYYDKEGLLSPTSESEGGRRLYTTKDMVKLHQILSLKSLGFSLADIKNRLESLDTPADVANVLTEQAVAIREKIKSLSESLEAIEALKTEVIKMQSVNFNKYADIILNLKMKNEFYWLIKHLDDKTLDYFRDRFTMGNGLVMMETFTYLMDKAIQLQKDGLAPESKKGQNFAKEFWDMIMEFTEGDIDMIFKLIETRNGDAPDNKSQKKQMFATTFIESALDAYFTKLNYNPFEEGIK